MALKMLHAAGEPQWRVEEEVVRLAPSVSAWVWCTVFCGEGCYNESQHWIIAYHCEFSYFGLHLRAITTTNTGQRELVGRQG